MLNDLVVTNEDLTRYFGGNYNLLYCSVRVFALNDTLKWLLISLDICNIKLYIVSSLPCCTKLTQENTFIGFGCV